MANSEKPPGDAALGSTSGVPAHFRHALRALFLALCLTPAVVAQADPYAAQREEMVRTQIQARGVKHPGVLAALREVPRHRFLPESQWWEAYEDRPVTIGLGQTMSQPYVVAFMTELLELDGDERVLEIGTGSGYHAAVLSRVANEVYSIEILEELAASARRSLLGLGYDNVEVRVGDGYRGWPEEAPFDAIVLTAAPQEIPPPLIDQLAIGGRMVAPVGSFLQDLQLLVKTADGVVKKSVLPVRFVPMTGEAQKNP